MYKDKIRMFLHVCLPAYCKVGKHKNSCIAGSRDSRRHLTGYEPLCPHKKCGFTIITVPLLD